MPHSSAARPCSGSRLASGKTLQGSSSANYVVQIGQERSSYCLNEPDTPPRMGTYRALLCTRWPEMRAVLSSPIEHSNM